MKTISMHNGKVRPVPVRKMIISVKAVVATKGRNASGSAAYTSRLAARAASYSGPITDWTTFVP